MEYNIWRKDRKLKSGGGVMILTKNDLIVKNMEHDMPDNVEMLSVEVITKERAVVITMIYMPPKIRAWDNKESSELVTNTVKDIRHILQKVEDKSNDLVLVGDFNSSNDWINWEVRGTENEWN